MIRDKPKPLGRHRLSGRHFPKPCEMLKNIAGRRAVVLMTDGVDMTAS